MANLCSVRMRIAAKDAKTIKKFIRDVRDNGDFRVYSGVLAEDEKFDPNLIFTEDDVYACDIRLSVGWSFVTAFEEDGVDKMFGKTEPSYDKYFHEFCKDYGVGVEVYTEESGAGFEEHYLISPSGQFVKKECLTMTEDYDEEEDEWVKEGGFGDPDFLTPQEILEAK